MCGRCQTEKPLTDFHRSASKSDGLQARCKGCNTSGARAWQEANPEKFEASWRSQYGNPKRKATKYGLTLKEMDTLFEKAGGICNICSQPPRQWLVIDHCHTTGAVRGILCEKCNQALGLMRDNVGYLENAIQYLNKSTQASLAESG